MVRIESKVRDMDHLYRVKEVFENFGSFSFTALCVAALSMTFELVADTSQASG